MNLPKFIGAGKRNISLKDRTFEVLQSIPLKNWLCLYDKRNFNDADTLFKSMKSACKAYKLSVDEPEWVEMTSNYAEDWTATVDDYMKSNKYLFVVFLIDRNDAIYSPLKRHS